MSLWHWVRYGRWRCDVHRGRDAEGRATEVCALCGASRVVLGEPAMRTGPAHVQRPDAGARTGKAQRAIDTNKQLRFPQAKTR